MKEDVFPGEFRDGNAEFDEVVIGELRNVLSFPTGTRFKVHLSRAVDDDFGSCVVTQKRTQRLQEVIDRCVSPAHRVRSFELCLSSIVTAFLEGALRS